MLAEAGWTAPVWLQSVFDSAVGRLRCLLGPARRQPSRTTATKPKVSALSTNASGREPVASSSAANAGPDEEGEVVEARPGAVGRAELGFVARRGWAGRRRSSARRRPRSRSPRIARPTMTQIDMSRNAAPAISSMITPRAMSVMSSTSRRSKRSATMPAGTDRTMYGHDARRADQAQHERVARLVPDQDEQRDEVQPVADRRHELADQQARQRPVGEHAPIGGDHTHQQLPLRSYKGPDLQATVRTSASPRAGRLARVAGS